jgi:hypothetical protein
MAFVVVLLPVSTGFAQGACERFKWNVAREHALFLGTATPFAAGAQEGAPHRKCSSIVSTTSRWRRLETWRLQFSRVRRRRPAENTYGGMARFAVPRAGRYRVSLDGRA